MAKSMRLACVLLGACLVIQLIECTSGQTNSRQQEEIIVSNLQAAANQADPGHQEESYQRVYEAFTRLVQNVSNNSLGNARRLVSRLNQLVGSGGPVVPATSAPVAPQIAQREQQQQQQQDEKTEQILHRLDQVNKQTDQHTLRQLQEDVNRLVGTLSESYLRNIRRVIERVNRTIGSSGQPLTPPQPAATPGGALRQATPDSPNGERDPGFPGWDELLTAVDRMQKSLANFVRSSTKLITAGRRR